MKKVLASFLASMAVSTGLVFSSASPAAADYGIVKNNGSVAIIAHRLSRFYYINPGAYLQTVDRWRPQSGWVSRWHFASEPFSTAHFTRCPVTMDPTYCYSINAYRDVVVDYTTRIT